jgi:hypothetical protein
MYIDFHKFNYDVIEKSRRHEYETRDKSAYVKVLEKWFDDNKEEFVSRKWEIDEIHYLKEIGDFINLVKEAESLYELGFFTSCIALVGVASEDFSKYLSLKKGKEEHIATTNRRGELYDVSQFNRLKLQLIENIISQSSYEQLDKIRKIRNDCLHFNDDFKQKNKGQIKNDAIVALNNLKQVLKEIIGTNIESKDFKSLSNELMTHLKEDNFEEVVWKQKNMLSHMLGIPLTQDPNVKTVVKRNIYKVLGVDGTEVDLQEIDAIYGTNLIVVVDLDEKGMSLVDSQSLEEGDIAFAEVYSNVAYDGQTREWFFSALEKLGEYA